jgi:thymidylate synthase
MESSKNRHGLYFARLIGYGIDHKTGKEVEHLRSSELQHGGNQLEFIINALKPGAQRMALQASIYDPIRDQTEARQSFPCLQHIAFVPDFARKTLALNAFYALQLLYVKGYGNWLGLLQLGMFVASQTGLRFERLNCYAGIEKMTARSRPQPGVLLDRLTDLCETCLGQVSVQVVGAKG